MTYEEEKKHFGAFRPKKPRIKRQGDLRSLADILPQVCDDMRFDDKVKEMSLLALWSPLVGESYRETTRAAALRRQGNRNILHVRVSDAAIASELSFQQETFKQQLNVFTPQTGIHVDAIRFVVGRLS